MLTSENKGNFFLKPYLRAANLKWLNIDVSDIKEMWFSAKELNKLRLQKNDLVVSEGGEVGRTAIWKNELSECYLQNSVHRIRLKHEFEPRYYLYHFFYLGSIGYFESIVNRISIGHLTGEKIREIFFFTPTINEQINIANYLDKKVAQIDNIINKKQQLIELLKEQRLAIISEAMYGKGKNWKRKKLKYVVLEKLKYGANEPAEFEEQNNPRYIRITDFDDDGKLRNNTFKSLPPEIAKEFLLKEGDILFARSGATVGKTFQFKNYSGIACFAGYLIKATPDPQQILSDFLYSFTKSGLYDNWKSSIFNQATIQNIGADKYSSLEIPIPSLEEQREIISHIQTETQRIDNTMAKIEKEITLIQEYKTALIGEVVTGKIKVA